MPLTVTQLRNSTRYDRVLCKVLQYTKTTWPTELLSDNLRPYWNHRNELSVEYNCLIWGKRVVVPLKLRNKVLKELHCSHYGVDRMKSIARSYVWWPSLDQEIERTVKSCSQCQSLQAAHPEAPLHPGIWPWQPWDRIHVDFAGPFFFVVIDPHSKWPEVIELHSTTTQTTITELRLFSMYGIPRQLVSDNGPRFTSTEFQDFIKGNGIKHIRLAPYHPSTNRQAERFTTTFKDQLKLDKTLDYQTSTEVEIFY